jgi:hypothetical protein
MGRSRCQDVDFRSWRRNGLSGETQRGLGPARGAIASPLTMDRVRQLPVGSERVTTDSFSRGRESAAIWRDLGHRPFFSRIKAKRVRRSSSKPEILRCKFSPLRSVLLGQPMRRADRRFGPRGRPGIRADRVVLRGRARPAPRTCTLKLHLHGKRAGVVPFSDFALDIRRIAARQALVGHAVTVERHSLELTVFGQIDPPVLLITNGNPSCYRDSGRLLSGRQAHEHRDFWRTSWHPSLSPSRKSDAPDGSESESNLPFFEDGRSLGGRGTGAVAARDRRAAVMVGAFKHRLQCADEPVRSSPTARPCTARRRAAVAALSS